MERNTRLLPLLTMLVFIPVLLVLALLWLRARRAHAHPAADKARAQMPATPLADAQCEPTPPRGPAVFSIGTAAASSSDVVPAPAKEQDDASHAEESEAAPAAHDEVVETAEETADPVAPNAPEGVPDELLTEDVDEPPPAAPLEEAAPSAAPESVDAQQADAAPSGARNPMAHKSRKPLPPVIKRRSPLSAPPKPM